MRVVDYAFDHISRPFLSKVISVFLGLAAVVTYFLTSLEQIDKTFGYAAGTAAVTTAGFIYARYLVLYQLFRRSNGVTKLP